MTPATLNGELSAWVYVLDDFEGGLPSARTIGLLADAAGAAAAPEDYVRALRGPALPQRLKDHPLGRRPAVDGSAVSIRVTISSSRPDVVAKLSRT